MRLLELVAARQSQQPFAGAVAGNLFGHHFGACDREMLFELGAHFLRDARHLVEALRAADIDPVPELLNAHLALGGRQADRRSRRATTRPATALPAAHSSRARSFPAARAYRNWP